MIKTLESNSASFQKIVRDIGSPVIMQIVPALNSGGVEQGVIDINRAIVEAGGQSLVMSSGGKRVPEIIRYGGTHIELPVNSKNPFIMAANIRRIRKAIRDFNVDIVHACSRAPAWSAWQAVKGTKAKYVTGCHAAHKIGGSLKRLYNSSITRGDLIITVSHFLSGYLQENYKANSDKIRVIHRGLAIENYHPNSVTPDRIIDIAQKWRVPDGSYVVILPARVSRIKGHMFFINALEKLGRKDIFCAFVGHTAGNENYVSELKKYIEDKNLGDQVRLVGTCSDMPAAYMLANLVVTPSLCEEGFGRIAIEAQAMGRPVIATNHGGSRETIIDGETGWLVEPNNVEEFAMAINEALFLNQRERAMLATRAMNHAMKNFTNEIMCSKTLDVYAELLEDIHMRVFPSNDILINDMSSTEAKEEAKLEAG